MLDTIFHTCKWEYVLVCFTAGTRRGLTQEATQLSKHSSRSSQRLQTRCPFITSLLHNHFCVSGRPENNLPASSSEHQQPRLPSIQLIYPKHGQTLGFIQNKESLIDVSLLSTRGLHVCLTPVSASDGVCDFQELFRIGNPADGFWTQSGLSSQRFKGQPSLNKSSVLLLGNTLFLFWMECDACFQNLVSRPHRQCCKSKETHKISWVSRVLHAVLMWRVLQHKSVVFEVYLQLGCCLAREWTTRQLIRFLFSAGMWLLISCDPCVLHRLSPGSKKALPWQLKYATCLVQRVWKLPRGVKHRWTWTSGPTEPE